jgi:5-methyltetrahydrofolate--homocysteine methyltransferase
LWKKPQFVEDIKAEYARLREHHEKHRGAKQLLSLEDARANKLQLVFDETTIYTPKHRGIHTFDDFPLELLTDYIDWTPFFQTWELHGRFPAIFEDGVVGQEARQLYADAQKMLQQIVSEKWLTAKAVVGIFPANSVGDDIEIYADETRSEVINVQHTLRQQTKKAAGQPNLALADFIAPKTSGVNDYIGGFVVTTGHGIDAHIVRFEADHDDYSSILIKALADRLAEAFAEYMHAHVRRELWGYAQQEALSNEELIQERYRGIRPAPGYPACPDHTEKPGLFRILDAERISCVTLTETLAMWPASSVSGWYFAHPDSKYFGLGKITGEQVEDIARRKGTDFNEMARWLGSNLND